MPWYRSGTVAITAGQTSVVGTNTDFAANARVGDAFQGPDGRWYEVANIASATVLSILPAYQGATVSAGGYGLAPMQGYVKDSADALRAIVNQYGTKLAALGTTGNYDILPVAKGGTGGATASDARTNLGLGSVATDSVVPVAKGGTGGTTAAAARSGLELGDASTKNVGTSAGQVMGVGAGGLLGTAPSIANLHNVLNTEFRSAAVPSNQPPGGDGYWNLMHIRAGVDARWTTIFAQEVNGYRLAFKTVAVDQSAATGWSMIYHSNNTTRAADGTLKAI